MFSGVFRGVRQQVTSPTNVFNANKDVFDDDDDTIVIKTTKLRILNPADDLTKPLGWVLHSRHARRIMEHYT